MDQNILTRQMQDQYVELQKRWEQAIEKDRRVDDVGPLALAVVLYLTASAAITWGLAWLASLLWGEDGFSIALFFIGFIMLMLGVSFCGAYGWTGWVKYRQERVDGIQSIIRHERFAWWKQVNELLDQSGRGTLPVYVGSAKTMDPRRTLTTPGGSEVTLVAFVKNGNVWLVDESGDILRRTYGDRNMTTVIGDDGTLMAVTGIAAKVMGEDADHPSVP